jgi:death-on-curing protein
VIFLELDELLHVAERTLGHAPHVRDHGLLESALARPRATAFGEDAYPRHPPQGSRVAAFAGAQPRAGRRQQAPCARAVLAFNGMHGMRVTLADDAAYNLVMSVAGGQVGDVTQIASVLARGAAGR